MNASSQPPGVRAAGPACCVAGLPARAPLRRVRPGVLLPTVLAVMVIIGFAATAALFMGRQERRTSRTIRLETTAAAATDESRILALAGFSSRAPRMLPGQSIVERLSGSSPGVTVVARLTRLGEAEFALAIAAVAQDSSGMSARRQSSVVLRLGVPHLGFPAALALTDTGAAPPGIADGRDRAPDRWPCPAELTNVADVEHPLPQPRDSAELRRLRERATVRLAPAAWGGMPAPIVRGDACATEQPRNWGDAARAGPCGSYFPIVHASGDLSLAGGSGQGVLIVDGNLTIEGGFEFSGAIIVVGELHFGPGGGQLRGGVRAARVVDAGLGPGSPPSIVRASCALRAALLATAEIVPVRERAWASER